MAKNFFDNFAALFSGVFIGQATNLLITPILTRMYCPEIYGIYTSFYSAFSIISVFVTLSYQMAIPLPKSDKHAISLTKFTIYISFVLSLLFFVVNGFLCFILKYNFTFFKFNQPLPIYITFIMPLAVFGNGIYQALSYLSSRKGLFQLTGRATFIMYAGRAIMQLFVGIWYPKAITLILAVVISIFLGAAELFRKTYRYFFNPNLKTILATAKLYSNFPKFVLPTQTVNVISQQMSPLLFMFFFGSAAAGYYALSNAVLGVPSFFIGSAVAQVFYPYVSKIQNILVRRKVVEDLSSIMLVVSFLLLWPLVLDGPFIFKLVFGNQWFLSGKYSQYLAIAYILQFLTSSISTLAIVNNRQKTSFLIVLYEIILRFSVICGGGLWAKSQDLTVIMLAIANAIIYLIYLLWSYSLVKASLLQVLNRIKKPVMVGLLVFLLKTVLNYFAVKNPYCDYGLLFMWCLFIISQINYVKKMVTNFG